MSELQDLLSSALAEVTAELENVDLLPVTAETNVFDAVDSFSVVDLMLETEMRLEEKTGEYVTLADESIFDAQKSPLLKWSDWVQFVEKRCAS